MGRSNSKNGKEIRELIERAERAGWRSRVSQRSGSHVMLFAPDGVGKITVSMKPGTGRAIADLRTRLRRGGSVSDCG